MSLTAPTRTIQGAWDRRLATWAPLVRDCSATTLPLQDCLASFRAMTERHPALRGQEQTWRLPPVQEISQEETHPCGQDLGWATPSQLWHDFARMVIGQRSKGPTLVAKHPS
eukprot:6049593-Amphidinium_carterae.1